MVARSMRLQVLLLASAQALFQTASVLVMTVGALAGGQIAPAPELATAPIAAMFLGTAMATVPASMWMARVGRRIGFIAGALVGSAGGLIAAGGIWTGSLSILAFGTFLVGAYQGFAQFYRFAASEVADLAFRPRAISLVLAGGIVAALLGPTLGRLGGPLLRPDYAGSFLLLTAVSLLAASLLLGLRVPQSVTASTETPGTAAAGRPLLTIVRQPAYAVALFVATTGYGIMILGMTATPLAMIHDHHSLSDASLVIQLHVLGMFLPSFFTGSLITRFGVSRVMLTGVFVLLGYVAVCATSTGLASFGVALALLGVGWNFLYVGGTTLLTTTHTAAERGRAQGFNDMTIFAVGLTCSLGAGVLLQSIGWEALNLLLLPWLAIAALALLWFGAGQNRREAARATMG
ncbi:MAG: MFS transporter [Acetobacteraceae bacterium]|nr:MFS transporter [Acetobacteraceae bacterium]